MKNWILTTLILGLGITALAQDTDLLQFNKDRLGRERTAMLVLGTWAVSNIAVGSVMTGKTSGENRSFHQMNAGWNAINLAIAGYGYYIAAKTDAASLDLVTSMKDNHNLQKLLLLNAGLDVGYLLGGAYLMEKAKNTENRPERLKGFGRSIVLQGAFLLAFDVSTYWIMASKNNQLEPLIGPDGLGMVFRF